MEVILQLLPNDAKAMLCVRDAVHLAQSMVGKPATWFMKVARAIQDLLGLHQDAVQVERHIQQFIKFSTSVRAAFVAGRMVERQRQRCHHILKDMKPLFRTLLKRGEKGMRMKGIEALSVKPIDYVGKSGQQGRSLSIGKDDVQ